MTETANVFDALDPSLQQKLRRCEQIIAGMGRVVVAFSGGVDSALLLALAVQTLGRKNVLAAVGVSPVVPGRELDDARQIIARLGAESEFVPTGEMEDPSFTSNPPNRCFHCKSDLVRRLTTLATQRGYHKVLLGANADDTGDYRPGMQAAAQLGAASPLLEAGLTKAEIRQASRALDLPTWDKPARACLASRVPYNQPITPEKLSRIEQGENALQDLGFNQCRVRDHASVARIEVPADRLAELLGQREVIVAELKKLGYVYVTLDLAGFRSGSMNDTL